MSDQPETENQFPTVADLRDALSRLVGLGLGELPVQVLVVPDSTIQAIARHATGRYDKPALMIELNYKEGSGRLPVSIMSTDRMHGGIASAAHFGRAVLQPHKK